MDATVGATTRKGDTETRTGARLHALTTRTLQLRFTYLGVSRPFTSNPQWVRVIADSPAVCLESNQARYANPAGTAVKTLGNGTLNATSLHPKLIAHGADWVIRDFREIKAEKVFAFFRARAA